MKYRRRVHIRRIRPDHEHYILFAYFDDLAQYLCVVSVGLN
jgi:hypothetical protein